MPGTAARSGLTLVIGDKNLSSWSLRPWHVLTEAGIPFQEVLIRLDRPDTRARILEHTPSGKVPCLIEGDITVWDSLAIAEHLNERFPETGLWPADRHARAMARSIAAEMHSSFAALRRALPMDFTGRGLAATVTPEVAADITRIVAIWKAARALQGPAASGPFLFGRSSIADAMYAPVVSRFTSYAVDLAKFGDDGTAESYRAAMMATATMKAWGKGAAGEVAGG